VSAGITGDFAGLDAAIRDVQAFASGAKVRKAVGAIGAELGAIARESFDTQRTPEGAPWRSLASGRSRPLVVTGKLRGMATRPLFTGLSVRFALPSYGPFQNDGTGTIPARPWLPAAPLSPAIEARLNAAALRVLR
jgi:hypothetical protein